MYSGSFMRRPSYPTRVIERNPKNSPQMSPMCTNANSLENVFFVEVCLAHKALPFKPGLAEIDEKADGHFCGFEVVQADGGELVGEAFAGFEFEHYFSLDE